MTEAKNVIKLVPVNGKLELRYVVNGVQFTSLMKASEYAHPNDHIKRNVMRWRVQRYLDAH